jgi:tetratricopeptide (TPR) repeat protein
MGYSRFSNIFWIDASSDITIEVGFMHIGQANIAPYVTKQSVGFVLHWISQLTGNWLIVYDGADGDYQIVEKFLPPGNGGNILITSRNGGLRRITLTSLNILNMADKEAASLILKSASLALDDMSDHIHNLATNLASELGGIPLALDQAGAYMLMSQCGIANYLELYIKHKHELMSDPRFKGASNYDKTTYGTWDISMQKIEYMAAKLSGEENVAAQSAIRILRIFAFLDHANIPQELFRNAAENYMKRDIEREAESTLPLSIRMLDHQTLFLSDNGVWEEMEFLAGIQVLISLSLIEAHSDLYSMHTLVHAWNRNRIPKADISNLYHKARALLSCSVVLDYDIDSYAFCKLLAPHVRINALHESELECMSTYYDDEYERFTLVFHHIGSWNEMERLLLVTAEWRRRVLGANHLVTLACIEVLATTYWNQGRWDEAEKLEVDIMNARKVKLGSDHPDTLTSMANLACTYRNQGRWNEAEKLDVDVQNAAQSKLGSDHPDTLTSMANLACTYRNQGRWNEAEKLEVVVVNAWKAKLGSDHPHTLTSMANLASTYRNQGRWDEAEKLNVDVMNARKAKLGSDHPDTLTSMANLASTYRNQGRWNEAEKLQVDVINARKQKLASNHPDMLTSMANLASTYWYQGRWDEAEKLQVDVMNALKAKLGSDHPDTLTSIANLSSTYMDQGRWNEAEKLQVDVMNARKAKLGSDHPDTLTSMANLASTYRNQGRWNEAEELEVDVMIARTAKLGSDHPHTLTSMANLATTYRYQGRWDEAEKLEVDVMNATKANLGPDHPDTLMSNANLALTYSCQGRFEEAHSLLAAAVQTMHQVMGTHHPTVLIYVEKLNRLSKFHQHNEVSFNVAYAP